MMAARFAGLSRWQRRALAFFCGVSATLALPPFFVFPALIPAFAGLLWLWHSAQTPRQAAYEGWWFGLGHYTTGFYWMCIALLTDPEKFAWLIPFTLIGLNGLLALFPAVAGWVYVHVKPRRYALAPLSFAALWLIMEAARGHILTGFPWNLAGYAMGFSDATAQGAAWLGVYGLTFAVVLAASATLVWRKGRWLFGLSWLGIALIAVAGSLRLPPVSDGDAQARIRIVQGNIDQHHKWDAHRQSAALQRYVELSIQPGHDAMNAIIWPETAVPFIIDKNPPLKRMLSDIAPPKGVLLTGALHAQGQGENFQIFNSVAAFTSEGLVARYDKHHLVPFGEFVPLRTILPLEKITPGSVDFSRGAGPQTLDIKGIPSFSPLICYEVIFPAAAVAHDQPRPHWLLNVTNDAWFGVSTGPYQHLHMARFRAIEQGLPLIRAANTGISAIIDSHGRIRQRLALGETGVVDGFIAPAQPTKPIGGSINILIIQLIGSFVVILTLGWRQKRPY